MGCYYTLYLNTYGYSLSFYNVYHEEGECQQLEFWLEKEQTLETYSALLQKSWNSTKPVFGINKNYWAEEITQGAHILSRRVGGAPYPMGAPPASWAPWWPSGAHLLLYEVFRPKKNHKQAFGTRLRRHKAEPWRNQSRAPTELLCWGNVPPGGGNHHHRHHHRSSHREGVNLHQHLHQHHLLSNPSSSLVSNSCLQVWDWYL